MFRRHCTIDRMYNEHEGNDLRKQEHSDHHAIDKCIAPSQLDDGRH
jgi:hypothetical protein